MKKVLCLFFAIAVVITLTACGDKSEVDSGKNPTESTDVNVESENENIKDNLSNEKWGVDENTITEKNDKKARAYIKFPNLCGIVEGTGKIAYQPDESLVLLGSEIDFEEPEVEGNKIENIFPAYFGKVAEIMEAYRGAKYKDFEFEITSKETVNVNGYEMCKYTGKHTFASRDNSFEMNFVAYATRLKGNDAVVYWMVLDETDDQSLSEIIESHADKMAQTLHE